MTAIRSLTPILLVVVASLGAAMEAGAQTHPFRPFDLPYDEAWNAAIEKGTRTSTGRPGAAYWTNRARYDLEIELLPAEARVVGRGRMVYVNRSKDEIDRLRLHLRQNLHAPGVERTRPDNDVTGGVTVDAVLLGGEPLSSGRGWRVRGTLLEIRLPEKLQPGAEIALALEWSFEVPRAGRAPRNGHEDRRVYYLAYFYPQFAVYDDVHGWVADQYRGNGEFYMGYADYDLAVTVPEGWIVRATGELVNPEDMLGAELRERLRKAREPQPPAEDGSRPVVRVVTAEDLAAGRVTLPSETGKHTWRFRAKDVRDVAVSASDRYLWDAASAVVEPATAERPELRTEIHAVYEADAGGWERAAEYARHAIESMSARVHPYPWPHMTVCEGIIGGGMEFPMMTIIGSAGRPRGVQGVIAHELIHMWFPMMAGSNEKWFAWMDEGTTSFYTSLLGVDFWGGEPPAPRSVRSYARLQKRRPGSPCMRHADSYVDGGFGIAAYTKPAAVLHQLRGMLGEEVFDRAMRRYVEDWRSKHPYPQDLWNTFEDVSGRELDWYFRTWHHEVWALDQAASLARRPDGVELRVDNLGAAIGPTVVELEDAGGRTWRMEIPVDYWLGGKPSWSAVLAGNVVAATLDPDGWTIDTDRSNNRARLE